MVGETDIPPKDDMITSPNSVVSSQLLPCPLYTRHGIICTFGAKNTYIVVMKSKAVARIQLGFKLLGKILISFVLKHKVSFHHLVK